MKPGVSPGFRTLAVLGTSPSGGWVIYDMDERRKAEQRAEAPVRVVRESSRAAYRRRADR